MLCRLRFRSWSYQYQQHLGSRWHQQQFSSYQRPTETEILEKHHRCNLLVVGKLSNQKKVFLRFRILSRLSCSFFVHHIIIRSDVSSCFFMFPHISTQVVSAKPGPVGSRPSTSGGRRLGSQVMSRLPLVATGWFQENGLGVAEQRDDPEESAWPVPGTLRRPVEKPRGWKTVFKTYQKHG